jgi:hypothetical protein
MTNIKCESEIFLTKLVIRNNQMLYDNNNTVESAKWDHGLRDHSINGINFFLWYPRPF